MKLIQYVRTESNNGCRGTPIGVVVGLKRDNGELGIGWSLTRKGDKYNPDFGLMIAENRAKNGFRTKVPNSVLPVFEKMTQRIAAYNKI